MIKILICNLALRSKPDSFPPVACTSLFNALKSSGYSPEFYNIDVKRPSFAELSNFFRENRFDIVGISAVVSTGYAYTKKLVSVIRSASPATQVILGGNLAAAYEVLLRKSGIDICVIGEGEKVLLNLVKYYEKYGSFDKSSSEMGSIRGIAYLMPDGRSRNTGYERLLPAEEIRQPDYELLDRFSCLENYLSEPLSIKDFACDSRSYEAKRRNMKMATIFASKGCINKCSFCHRWISGYRILPVWKVIDTMKYLMERHNVGFFCFSDECFGEDEKWLKEFIRLVKPMDVLFQVGGARISILKKGRTIFSQLKDAGLTAIYFGMESGSDKILKVMGKNATSAENLDAAELCAKSGVYTVVQLVIGMPGENEQTINETIEFVGKATGGLPYLPELSVNYLQALPGTPCYEYLRMHGFLGNSIEDEERYLINISDINATEFRQYINVSEEPMAMAKIWKMKINLLARINWLKRHGWKFPGRRQGETFNYGTETSGSFFKPVRIFLKTNAFVYMIIDLMGGRFWGLFFLKNCFSMYGFKRTVLYILRLLPCVEDRSLFKMGPECLSKAFEKDRKELYPREVLWKTTDIGVSLSRK